MNRNEPNNPNRNLPMLSLDDFPPYDIAADSLFSDLLAAYVDCLEPLSDLTGEDERGDPVVYLARQAAFHAAKCALITYINAYTARLLCQVLQWDRDNDAYRKG